MGGAATIVTALAVYTQTYTVYNVDSTSVSQAAYVLGAKYGFAITGGASGDIAILFNSTGGNTGGLGLINCTIVAGACQTPLTLTLTGTPYTYDNFYVLEDQVSGTQDFNLPLTVFVLPPVPSQPLFPSYTTGGSSPSINWVASNASSEFDGAPMIGCVMGWGLHPYLGTDLPTTLSNGQTLPSNQVGAYGIAQSSRQSYALSTLGLTAGAVYDFHYKCYNSQGPSPDTAIYSFVGSLATPAALTSLTVAAPDNTTLYVTWATPQYTGDVGPLVNSTFRSCTVTVGPKGFQLGQVPIYYKFTSGRIKVSSTTTLTVRGGFNLASTPIIDVIVYCNNSRLSSPTSRQSTTGLLLPPSNAPVLVYHDAEWAAPFRLEPTCAIDIHAVLQRSSTPILFQMGGYTSASIDVSTTGSFDAGFFQTISPSFNGYNTSSFWPYTPAARWASGAAVTGNGNIVWFGGKGSASACGCLFLNDVVYSTDQGKTFNVSNRAAPWGQRSDMTVAVAPKTNVIIMVGGSLVPNGVNQNDVWMTSDGTGATWTRQTSAAPYTPFTNGALVFMYDSVTAGNGGTKAIATLVLYNPGDNKVYQSSDYGVTWSTGVQATFSAGGGVRFVADLRGWLYLLGGSTDGSAMYFSTDLGNTFSLVNQQNFNQNITGAVTVTSSVYGCAALTYRPAATSTTGYHQAIVLYGGTMYSQQNVYSGFQCVNPTATALMTSVTGELLFPGESYSAPIPSSQSQWTGVPRVTFHDPSNVLPSRANPSCTYDVHAVGRRSSSPAMWQLGGWPSSSQQTVYLNTIDYSNSSAWAQFTTMTPTGTSGLVPGRVAGGAAYLNSGLLLWFGGKDAASSYYVNDVYSSMDNGQTFSLVTGGAQWSQRSDMSVAVMPGTNTVVMVGGQSAGSVDDADVWLCNDNAGLTWSRQTGTTPFSAFQNAAFTALYDGNSGATPATLVLYSGSNAYVWTSSNSGQTWTQASSSPAPWQYRQRNQFVADADNYLYMTGGSTNGDVWMSTDKGATWAQVQQLTNSPTTPYANVARYQQSQNACFFIRYSANSQSPGNYHKQLILFGGAPSNAALQVAQQPAPSCVKTQFPTLVFGDILFAQEQQSSWTDSSSISAVPQSQLPTIAYNSPAVLLTSRVQPDCAVDVHAAISRSSTPTLYQLGGWDVNNNPLNTLDVIQGNAVNGFAYVSPTFGGLPPAGRVSAGASVLSSGLLLWFGGKTNIQTATVSVTNDVWSSTNQGSSFMLATQTAPWPARSDMSVAAVPATLCTVMMGGQAGAGSMFNDVWSSCDGIGAIWSVQTGAAPFPPFIQGALVALYDSSAVNSGYSQQYSTLLAYTDSANQIFQSTDLGVTWATIGQAPWSYRETAKFTADIDGGVYFLGGQGFSDAYYSTSKGQSWSQLRAARGVSGLTSPVSLSSAAYSCDALIYTSSSSAPNGYHKQLVVYGGAIEVYSSTSSSRSGATSISPPICSCDSITGIRAVLADLIFPGETYTGSGNSAGTTPQSGGSSSNDANLSKGAVAGIVIGVAAGVALLCLLFFWLCLLNRRNTSGGSTKKAEQSYGASRFENEPSQSAPAGNEGVEMGTA